MKPYEPELTKDEPKIQKQQKSSDASLETVTIKDGFEIFDIILPDIGPIDTVSLKTPGYLYLPEHGVERELGKISRLIFRLLLSTWPHCHLAWLAQPVERWAFNPTVVGSSPTLGFFLSNSFKFFIAFDSDRKIMSISDFILSFDIIIKIKS